MLTIIMAVFGLMLGSFLSVLLERLGRKEGIVAGRSECPHCQHILAWYDLVPLLSYVILLGRCRYCRAKISMLYPVLEMVMALVLGGYVFLYGVGGSWAIVDLIVLFGLVALFFFDLRYQILPDIITGALVGLVVVRLVTSRPDMLTNAIATAVLLGGILTLLYLVSHGRWFGFGDVKLAVLMGLLFGYPGTVGVTLLAVWAGALVGVGLMLTRRANMKTALPFGSFWTAVAIITILWPGPVFFISGLFTP
jgi:prepilin signal peptidase PulO-like enzyme (type II secretory pathway)